MATLLHIIFQNQGILPSKIMSLTAGERAFCFASTIKALEDGDVPVKVKNFAKREESK